MFTPFFMRSMRTERLALQSELADLEAEMAADFNVKSLEELGYDVQGCTNAVSAGCTGTAGAAGEQQ